MKTKTRKGEAHELYSVTQQGNPFAKIITGNLDMKQGCFEL